MSSILQPVIDRLRAAGPASWERIAADAGVAKTLPRKLVYGDRENPGVLTIQPLIDYFDAVDRGARQLPDPAKEAA
jgi:hypothetical protein